MTMTGGIRGLLAMLVLLAAGGGVRADSYYVVVFGAESKPQRPKYSHSWATFVHVCGDDVCGPPTADAAIEWFTISWLPCKVELTPNRPFAETGRNFDLPTTFDIALAECESVWGFGPYEIDCRLYKEAHAHYCRLQSGRVRYKTLDWERDPRRVSNCIHALTVFIPFHFRVHVGRVNYGAVASWDVTRSYERYIICKNQVCWVADALGLAQYPIKWRTWDDGRPRPRNED
jgi:hypothetical protein